MGDDLKDQLLGMKAEDLRVRAELAAAGELFLGYGPRMREVHARNATALEAIVDRHGWPSKSVVGADAADAAWLILQHAIEHPALQRRVLPLLKAGADNGEVDSHQAACLEDRISFFEGRAQRFGTQFDWDDDGQLSPWRLQDPERVDQWRRSVGLGPLSEAVQALQDRAASEGQVPPADLQVWRQQQRAWAQSVGWI